MVKKNMFAEAHKKREAEEAEKLAKCLKEDTNQSPQKKKKIRVDFTLSEEAKNKLFAYATKQGLSASVIIQMLINENCV